MLGGTDRDFDAFVAARYDALVRFGYLLLGDRGQAEDLAQSALLRTFGAWRGVRDVASAEAYVRTAMVRLSLRWRRRGWRAEVLFSRMPEADADDPYAASDLADAVRGALQALPPQQRAVVVLRFYADLTVAETAEALGCSTGTVKSRTSRALAALRTAGLLDHDPDVEGQTHG